MRTELIVSLTLLAFAGVMTPCEADAATRKRTFIYDPAAFCDATNPGAAGQPRRFPYRLILPYWNTGSLVSCGIGTDTQAGSTPIAVGIRIRNEMHVGGRTVTCSLVAGSLYDVQRTVKRELALGSNGIAAFTFEGEDLGGFKEFAFDCLLPAWTSVQYLWVVSHEDVGT